MKNQKQTIKCSECNHCSGLRCPGSTSTSFTCSHPDQGYIQDYFREKRMNKMPGFLGYGARYSEAVPIKTSPAWCPEKKGGKTKTKRAMTALETTGERQFMLFLLFFIPLYLHKKLTYRI